MIKIKTKKQWNDLLDSVIDENGNGIIDFDIEIDGANNKDLMDLSRVGCLIFEKKLRFLDLNIDRSEMNWFLLQIDKATGSSYEIGAIDDLNKETYIYLVNYFCRLVQTQNA